MPIRVLFDEGSQINLIASRFVKRLRLQPTTLQEPLRLQGANAHVSALTTYIHTLLLTLPATNHRQQFSPLSFKLRAAIADSPFDLIIGSPFLTLHNITHHYCNNTLVYIAPTGHRYSIPLLHSNLTSPCKHSFCPFTTAPHPSTVLPALPTIISPLQLQTVLHDSQPNRRTKSPHTLHTSLHTIPQPPLH